MRLHVIVQINCAFPIYSDRNPSGKPPFSQVGLKIP